jgi:hypothetical protein
MTDISQLANRVGGAVSSPPPISLHYLAQGEGQGGGGLRSLPWLGPNRTWFLDALDGFELLRPVWELGARVDHLEPRDRLVTLLAPLR